MTDLNGKILKVGDFVMAISGNMTDILAMELVEIKPLGYSNILYKFTTTINSEKLEYESFNTNMFKKMDNELLLKYKLKGYLTQEDWNKL